MKRARPARLLPWLLLALATGACGPMIDGGPVGTGISTQVAGNVVLVEDPAGLARATAGTDAPSDAAGEETGIAGVVVSLDEYPALSTVTDASGRFALTGNLEGDVNLRFLTPGFETTVALIVTAGETLILSDVALGPSGVSSDAIQAFAQAGRIAAVDCAATTPRLQLETGAGRILDVALAADVEIVRGDVSIGCRELTHQQAVRVSGLLSPDDLSLEAFRVELGRASSPEPGETHAAPVRGRIAAIDCDRGVLALDDGKRLQRLVLLPATTLTNPAGTALACDNIAIGAALVGRGVIRVSNPGRVELSSATVGATTAGPRLRFGGLVTETDCTRGLVLLVRGSLRQRILVNPATAGLPADGCAALPVGAWLDGHGTPLPDSPHLVLAEAIRLRRPAVVAEPQGRP